MDSLEGRTDDAPEAPYTLGISLGGIRPELLGLAQALIADMDRVFGNPDTSAFQILRGKQLKLLGPTLEVISDSAAKRIQLAGSPAMRDKISPEIIAAYNEASQLYPRWQALMRGQELSEAAASRDRLKAGDDEIAVESFQKPACLGP